MNITVPSRDGPGFLGASDLIIVNMIYMTLLQGFLEPDVPFTHKLIFRTLMLKVRVLWISWRFW